MFEMNIQSSKLNCSSQKTFELGLRSDFNFRKNQESNFYNKIFKFLNRILHDFNVGKSVSNSQNLLAGSTAVLLETLF